MWWHSYGSGNLGQAVTDRTDWPQLVSAWRSGGFYDRVMAGGAELDRVKAYLMAFAGEGPATGSDPSMAPTYPCFPGLGHRAFHDPATCPGVGMLEASFGVIRDEAVALGEEGQLDYSIASKPWRKWRDPRTWFSMRAAPRAWTVYPF